MFILIFYGKLHLMPMSASDIYQKLLDADIHNQKGEIRVEFMGVNVRMRDRSAIGNLLQEWLANWLTANNIDFRVKNNTQEFPDFLLHQNRDDIGLLEVKTFDAQRSANFDVANFDAYCRSLQTSAYRLDADGYISIPKMWLKKIWEITGASERYPLKCQIKQGVIYNIRPITWYSDRVKYPAFTSRSDFITAIHNTLALYHSDKVANNWLNQIKSKYIEQVGHPL